MARAIKFVCYSDFCIQDVFGFVNEFVGSDFSQHTLASFDVVSLFTNIPLERTISMLVDELFADSEVFTFEEVSFSRAKFEEALRLAVCNQHFIFDGKVFVQTDGVAMGSPLGPLLANFFLSHVEKNLVQLDMDYSPIVYRRYVDDTFLVFREPSHVSRCLDYFNSLCELSFTSEVAVNKSLPFIGLSVDNNCDELGFSVFRKTEIQLTSVKSHLCSRFKFFAIHDLVNRAIRLSSSLISLHSELDNIRAAARSVGLSAARVDRVIAQQSDSVPSLATRNLTTRTSSTAADTASSSSVSGTLPTNAAHSSISSPVISEETSGEAPVTSSDSAVNAETPGEMVFVRFPFINDSRVRAISELLRGSNIRPVFVSPGSLYSSLRVKEVRIHSVLGLPCVVYKFVCRSCDNSYIGYTSRPLGVRINEHVRPSSPLSVAHRELCPVPIPKDSIVAIDSARTIFDLRIKEAVHIRVFRPFINTRMEGLSFRLRL